MEEYDIIRRAPDDNPNIDHYMVFANSHCIYCKYRKEKCPRVVPCECVDCGWLKDREVPNWVKVPVWKDGYTPTPKERVENQTYFN